jgi:hypothetical protein
LIYFIDLFFFTLALRLIAGYFLERSPKPLEWRHWRKRKSPEDVAAGQFPADIDCDRRFTKHFLAFSEATVSGKIKDKQPLDFRRHAAICGCFPGRC